MSDNSHIQWTDSTWNVISGCTKVSPGCDHCYIERTPPFRMAHRKFDGQGVGATTGVVFHSDRLDQPLRWRKPRRVFVNSMSDLFHDDVPDEFIAQVFAVMAIAHRHTFQVLTKRHGRMRSLLSTSEFRDRVNNAVVEAAGINLESPAAIAYRPRPWPLPNVWLGASVENQQWADIRVPALLDTPAAVRFLSCEPLLGPVKLNPEWAELELMAFGPGGVAAFPRVDWVIVGGESGPGARPMHRQWARELRDQCESAGVPFFFKQWGEWAPTDRLVVGAAEPGEHLGEVEDDGRYPDFTWRRSYRRVGKKAAGRVLDGRTWDEYPGGSR